MPAPRSPTPSATSSIALLNMSDMSSFSNISKGSPMPAPRSPTPSATSTSPFLMLVNMSLVTRSSSSLLEIVLDTLTVHSYMMGSALGGGGGGLFFFTFFGAAGSRFSQRPKPMYLYLLWTTPESVSISRLLSPLGPAPVAFSSSSSLTGTSLLLRVL